MDMKNYLGLRRLRQNALTRELCREVRVSHEQLIQPLFVVDGIKEKEEISGLRGTFRDTPETLLKQVESDVKVGCRKFLLFGVPKEKRSDSFCFDFTAKQIDVLKKNFGDEIWLAADVCLCAYTDHGHCGILSKDGLQVLNAPTTEVLAQQSLVFAQAGVDCVAPSDVMDGRVGAMRCLLDESGYDKTILMSYSAKFKSCFYGPFRVACDSSPSKGKAKLKDRATYQIDPSRRGDGILSSFRDLDEGADILMVKPAIPYLDVLHELAQEVRVPIAAYHVSGECAALEFLAENQLADRSAAYCESWMSIIRAGASMIMTYGARYGKEWLLR
jgi:porphobilinogen synthase